MRKKKERHEKPVYTKATNERKHSSKTQHSILHKHEQQLAEFRNKTERVKQCDTKLKAMTRDLEKHKKERAYAMLNGDMAMDTLVDIEKLESEIAELELQRKTISEGQDEITYILDSSQLVMEYMHLQEEEQAILGKQEQTHDETIRLNHIVKQKNDLADEYLKRFDPKYVSYRNTYDTTASICSACQVPYEVTSGFWVCPVCGITKPCLDTHGDLSFKEMQDYDCRPQFTYVKETHLEDWLRRFQAKENRVIPQDVLDKVVMQANKERIGDLQKLTEDKVKRYLKKLELNEYYDNVISIINRINGRPPFTLTSEIEDKIKTMFQQIQEPFERYKPKNRKNFLSYSYTLHKIFQILGLHEFSHYFPLLKSQDKLRQQDEIFKKIVAEMAMKDKSVHWVFYPSI